MHFEKLERLIDTMPQRGIPACDLKVTLDGETVFRRMAGYSDVAGTRPVSENDLYWIFSATKPITCTAGMRLIEDGKLSLDDPVSKYLPEFAHLTVKTADGIVPCQTPMTVRHLFTMHGGMNYDLQHPILMKARENRNATTRELVAAMAREPLDFEPGAHWQYSLCHDVLAAVIEVASDMTFGEYLKKVMFDPLGMENTGFFPTEEQKKRFSAQYDYCVGSGKAIPVETGCAFQLSDRYESGGAGLFSSTDDYCKVMTALACDGVSPEGYRLLKSETIAQMEVNHLDPARTGFPERRMYGYGFGLCGRVHIDPAYSLSPSSIGEFGWDGAAAAFAMVDRPKRIGMYFATHIFNCEPLYIVLHAEMRRLFIEGLE